KRGVLRGAWRCPSLIEDGARRLDIAAVQDLNPRAAAPGNSVAAVVRGGQAIDAVRLRISPQQDAGAALLKERDRVPGIEVEPLAALLRGLVPSPLPPKHVAHPFEDLAAARQEGQRGLKLRERRRVIEP